MNTDRHNKRFTNVRANVLFPLFFGPFTKQTGALPKFESGCLSTDSSAASHELGTTNGRISLVQWLTFRKKNWFNGTIQGESDTYDAYPWEVDALDDIGLSRGPEDILEYPANPSESFDTSIIVFDQYCGGLCLLSDGWWDRKCARALTIRLSPRQDRDR